LLSKELVQWASQHSARGARRKIIELLTAIEKGSSIGDIASQLGRTRAECRARLDEITESRDSIFPRETAAS
jgi:hypothetical protein